MLEQSIDGTHILDQRRRTGLIWQRETIDSAKDLRQLGAAAAANALRMDLVRRTRDQAEIDAGAPLRRASFEDLGRGALMRRPKFVVVNDGIGDGCQFQRREFHLFDARAQRL